MSSNRPRQLRHVATLALGAALLSPLVMLAAAPVAAGAGGPLTFIAPTPAHAADAALAGSVTEVGNPVSRVVVSAYRWDEASGSYVFEQDTESLSDGTWELSFLPDGAYTLQFDTTASTAQFALGESLGGNASHVDDTPTVQISGGAVQSSDVTAHDLTRLGGSVTLSVTRSGTTLTDLEDAVAELRGVNAAGEPVSSRPYFASKSGELTVARVPAGGYIPWLGAGGSRLAPASADLIVTAGKITEAGTLELGDAPKDAVTGPAPQLSGSPRVGSELKVSVEVTPAAQLSYRWSTASGHTLKATGSSLALNDKLAGERVQAWVFARTTGVAPYVGVAVSEPIAASDTGTGGTAASGTADTAGTAAGAAGAADGGTAGTDSSSASASAKGNETDGSLAITGGAALTWLGALGALLLAAGAAFFLRKRARQHTSDTTTTD